VLALPDDEIHLWFAFSGDFADAGVSARGVLSPDETARLKRLGSAEGRRLFMMSRFLARTALSLYWPRAPEEWRFAADPHGKPLLDPGLGPVPLRFSLSHTAGLAVFALARGKGGKGGTAPYFSREGGIGVDVEALGRPVNAEKISSRFFSPEETVRLRGLPPERAADFSHYWTLKEACLKALGRGLALPLSSVSFRLSEDSPRLIEFSGAVLPDPEAWRFALVEPAAGYVAAVGVVHDRHRSVKAACRRVLPSGAAVDLDWRPVGRSEGVEFLS